jgi:hypothetical protein
MGVHATEDYVRTDMPPLVVPHIILNRSCWQPQQVESRFLARDRGAAAGIWRMQFTLQFWVVVRGSCLGIARRRRIAGFATSARVIEPTSG